MEDQLNLYLQVACEAARAGGRRLLKYYGKAKRLPDKGLRDVVTQADLEAESAILESINKHFPSHGIVTEESGVHNKHSKFRWIIDPLDGTPNFLHGLENFSVSIALQANGAIVAAVIYQPLGDSLFKAVRGRGAYLNDQRLKVSETPTLDEALIGFGLGTSTELRQQQEQVLQVLLRHCGAIRQLGSAAMELCYVARGIYDGFLELGVQPWDVAAGVLIVREAGGRITQSKRGLYAPVRRDIVASNNQLHSKLVNVVEACSNLTSS